ncbi:MAG: fatty acid desaturase [Leptospiraceae bacterium]|nr:fatty acid desaturase [Leptospiraceae bacterium]MCP5493345.1 fatty acid desaturase [Leptospiraceae bacterium]
MINHTPKETLSSVRDILSDTTFENPTYKGIFYFIRSLFLYTLVIFLLWNTQSWYFIPILWFMAGLSISGLFVIGHDCAHGALFKSNRLNYWIGQISMLPSLHAYNQWAYGHNRIHHGHTVKRQADFVWHPATLEEYQSYNLLQKALHKVYWSFLGAGIYYLIEIWLKGMVIYSAPLKEARRDKHIIHSFILIVSGLLIYLGGNTEFGFDIYAGLWLLTKMFFVPFIIWNYFIGFTVYIHHIHKEIPWREKEDWTPFYGQMRGTINYHVNPVYNFFIHNIYIHAPHHVHMKIPFYNLKKALEEIKSVYGGLVRESNSILGDYIRSTAECKLIDSQTGEWMDYKKAQILAKENGLTLVMDGGE